MNPKATSTISMSASLLLRSGAALLAALGLAACGGSGGSGGSEESMNPPPSTSVNKSVVGPISGFGSVYVNGVRFNTTGASYTVDDSSAMSDSALAVGMVVKIDGAVNADGVTGSAFSISYDDELEGRIEDLSSDADDPSIKIFTILNTLVQVSKTRTNFDGEDDDNYSFESLMNGDNVEVSGEYNGDILIASYVEKQELDDDDFEVKGTVTDYDNADQFVLNLRNGNVLNVTLAPGALIPSVGIANGQYVEIEGTIPDPAAFPDSVLATKVELEDDDGLDDGDTVEIEGVLNYQQASESWSIRDVPLAFLETTSFQPASLRDRIVDTSAAGLIVEVEGNYLDGVLQVDTIELEEDDLEFKADASVLSSTGPRDGILRLTFGAATGTIDVVISAKTLFLDDDAMNPVDLSSINGPTKVEIEARRSDDGTIIASFLKLEDDTGFEIEAQVDAITDVSITVLGVTFNIDETTVFEDGLPVPGDMVEIEDENGDGFADSVEIDD